MKQGDKMNLTDQLIRLALHNARVIHWFDSLTPERKLDVRQAYANHLGCSLCEITEVLLDSDDIAFLWNEYREQILVDLG